MWKGAPLTLLAPLPLPQSVSEARCPPHRRSTVHRLLSQVESAWNSTSTQAVLLPLVGPSCSGMLTSFPSRVGLTLFPTVQSSTVPMSRMVPPLISIFRSAWGSSMLETAGNDPLPSGSKGSEGMSAVSVERPEGGHAEGPQDVSTPLGKLVQGLGLSVRSKRVR